VHFWLSFLLDLSSTSINPFASLIKSLHALGATDLCTKLAPNPSWACCCLDGKEGLCWASFWPLLSWLFTPLSSRDIDISEGKEWSEKYKGEGLKN